MPANFGNAYGWTVKEMADECGVPAGTVYNWERKANHYLERVCPSCNQRRQRSEMRERWYRTCIHCKPETCGKSEQTRRPRRALRIFDGLDQEEIRTTLAQDVNAYLYSGKQITFGDPPRDPRRPWTSEPLGTNKDSRES